MWAGGSEVQGHLHQRREYEGGMECESQKLARGKRWRESSVGKGLAAQSLTHRSKREGDRGGAVCNPSTGEADIDGSLGLTSQSLSLISRAQIPVRESLSKHR